jgi:LPXTG-motif cell wall-anchored protein
MLLETVLGPLWIWWGIGEEPTNFMLLGGLIVILSLAAFLIHQSKKKSTGPSPGTGSGDA